ncbi:MAG TPA: TAXI family TRAP transporter solute-binding subunit [Alphaproteobacteria bacterium]|nr:TAXI family TRAP transporter solute-binding subunit [Alphaproteobacteria bacterium]
MKKILSTAAAVGFAAAFTATGAGTAQAEFIKIGTGGQTGVYYQVGQAICRLVNRGKSKHQINCTAPSTGGSVANLNALRAGELAMGVAQSDWQYHAYHGTSKFKDKGAFKELRAVFSVHPEPFTVVARADSGIKSFMDLKGKRVNIGNVGSGQRGTMEVVMGKLGWKVGDFKLATELKSSEQAKALCDNKVDAIVFTVGHPNGSIKEATTSCAAMLVPVTGPAITKLAADNDFYAPATIPAGMYKGTKGATMTFGVGATFVSSSKVSDKVVYTVVKAVFDNIKRFRRMHPAFRHLKEKDMIKNMLSAPIHPGAAKYYKEKGWM